jgi:hypothetical protein
VLDEVKYEEEPLSYEDFDGMSQIGGDRQPRHRATTVVAPQSPPYLAEHDDRMSVDEEMKVDSPSVPLSQFIGAAPHAQPKELVEKF